jgi:alpha-1,6-mannosyltransferase
MGLRENMGVAARVLLIGIGSGLLYSAVHVVQRALQQGTEPDAITRVSLLTALYLMATLVLFGLYAFLLLTIARRGLPTRTTRVLAIAFPIGFNIFFLLLPPTFSIDLFSYISHGYIKAVLHGNPYVDPSSAVAQTALGPELAAYGWRPVHPVSPYGPAWTLVEYSVGESFAGVRIQMTIFKTIVVAASLGSCWLIWIILGRVSPQHQLVGTLAYLWNPVIIVELAGEGHNDAVMVFFVLLALALTLQRRSLAAIGAMSLGILTKYLPLLLVPLQTVYLWRTRRSTARFAAQVTSGAVVGSVLAFALFAPLWARWQTFTGIRTTGQPGDTGSTPTVILHFLSWLIPSGIAEGLVYVMTIGVLLAYLVVRARSITDQADLLRAASAVSLAYLLIASPSYWPWYTVLPVGLLALVPGEGPLALLLAVSLGARLVAPLDVMFVNGVIGRRAFLMATWAGGVGLPLLIVLATALKASSRSPMQTGR